MDAGACGGGSANTPVLQFDAPIGYPSITANYTPEWKKWWFNPKDVTLYQFMGKDNVYFHTVYWPSVQLGDGRDWTMLHHINSTGEIRGASSIPNKTN
jgi:methionyl-tRNA synthetase